MNDYYYQAGVVVWTNRITGKKSQRVARWTNKVIWSDHIHNTKEEAVKEANRLAVEHGGTPVVEYWRREYGKFREDAPRTNTFVPSL